MSYRLLENERCYLSLLKEQHTRNLNEDDPKVKIDVENPGMLEVPEGKDVEDLPENHFKDLIKKKGWEEISRALTNLNVWNKDRDPSLSNWADNMQQKLSKWVEDQREEKDDPNLYEQEEYKGKEYSTDKEGYQKYFKDMMKREGIKSLNDLSRKEKAVFFKKVERGWQSEKNGEKDSSTQNVEDPAEKKRGL